MRALLALVLVTPLLAATDSINAFGEKWDVQAAQDWVVGNKLLQLKVAAEPVAGQPRRPTRSALLESRPYRKVTVAADIKRNGRSLIIVYAWQDEAHYDYAHISVDA